MILAKNILLMFQINACMAGLMRNAKSKRSPADSFSLFGLSPFSLTSSISRAQQSLSSVGQLFTSPLHRHRNEENLYQPVKVLSVIDKDESSPYDIPTNASLIQNPYVKPNKENSFSADLIKSNTVEEYIELKNTATIKVETNSKSEKNRNEINENKKDDKENITSNSSEQFLGIDQELINSIFMTTTEDNLDYTTGTYDDNNTTTDELLRIPSAAVASLLGK